MQIIGEWYLCDDGVERPAVRVWIQRAGAEPIEIPLLIDTGADRTVFSANLLPALEAITAPPPADRSLAGVGGLTGYRLLQTALIFSRDDGQPVTVRGQFAIFTDLASSDLSVLGRDVLDNFAVIVDRPANAVLLLAPRHQYRVEVV
jgi:hypothetical protein